MPPFSIAIDFACGVGEIDCDRAGGEGIAGAADPGEDFVASVVAEAGMGLEDADGVAHGVVGGEDAVLVLEAVGEPLAKTVGCDGAGFVCHGASGDGSPGVAGFGCEWGGDWKTFKDWGHVQLPWSTHP